MFSALNHHCPATPASTTLANDHLGPTAVQMESAGTAHAPPTNTPHAGRGRELTVVRSGVR